jgi:hypothetical protein
MAMLFLGHPVQREQTRSKGEVKGTATSQHREKPSQA